MIEPQCPGAGPFAEGLAAVVTVDAATGSAKFVFIDMTGKYVIEPQFDLAGNFAEGRAVVTVGNLWGFVDPSGKVIVEPQYARAADFSEGLAAEWFVGNGQGPVEAGGGLFARGSLGELAGSGVIP